MKETQTVLKEIDYLFEVRKLLNNNSLITDAWLDDPDHPRELHIHHKKSFKLHHCKMSIPLASLKLVFHQGPPRATKPRVSSAGPPFDTETYS